MMQEPSIKKSRELLRQANSYEQQCRAGLGSVSFNSLLLFRKAILGL